jgi:hypothetical protein
MLEFLAGLIVGAVGFLFLAYLMTKREPKAEPPVFSATSSGADDEAGYLKAIFRNVERQ